MSIMAPGKRSGRKIYVIIEQALSNCFPGEEGLETLNTQIFIFLSKFSPYNKENTTLRFDV